MLGLPLDATMTPSDFLVAGGIQYDRDRLDGKPFPDVLLADIPERASPVQVGPYTAVLTWADPLANGVRSHNLYWSDGAFNYGLIADRSALDLVDLGRSLVCATE